MSISINYIENLRYLTENEWTNMINNCIRKIKHTKVGNLLIESINYYISIGHDIRIINYSRSNIFQYPNMNYSENGNKYTIKICIPDTPYFTKVPIMSPDLKELADVDQSIKNIYDFNEIENKLDNDFVSSFSSFEFQPVVVVLFHELIHALRLFKGIHDNNVEEEATMYGIIGSSLYLNGTLVTENTFRREIGLSPRISHESQYLHVYGTTNMIDGKSKEFWKKTFNSIKVNL